MPEITETLHVTTREDWRSWLAKNHADVEEIWLVYYKKHTGLPRVAYGDAVEEAICFGWIDGIIKRIDEDRYTQRFSPRKRKSAWSALNRRRAGKMIAERRMTDAGLLATQSAKEDGTWEMPERDLTQLTMPADLREALATESGALDNFIKLAPSHQRNYFGWIEEAKKEATRRRRINITVQRSLDKMGPGMM